MNLCFLLALVGLAIILPFSTFAQQKDTVDPQVAEQIRALATKFDEHSIRTMQSPSPRF
jgi:hypothetical protein